MTARTFGDDMRRVTSQGDDPLVGATVWFSLGYSGDKRARRKLAASDPDIRTVGEQMAVVGTVAASARNDDYYTVTTASGTVLRIPRLHISLVTTTAVPA